MTIMWSEAQLRKHQAQHEGQPQPIPTKPKPKKKRAVRERVQPPEGPQVRSGCFGLTRHRWKWWATYRGHSVECWVSLCGSIWTSRKPNGKRGKRECAGCKEETP